MQSFTLWFIASSLCLITGAFPCRAQVHAAPLSTEVTPHHVRPGQRVKVTYNREFFFDQRVYIHFGFNGWNYPTSGPGSGSETIDGNLNYFQRKLLTFNAEQGAYEVELDIPVDANSLHYVFCWSQCSNSQWDNNGKKDFSWPVAFPYIGPLLTWNETTRPDTGIVITFENSWASQAWLEYWPEAGPKVRIVDALASMHRFQIHGLAPDTTYSYRVGLVGEPHTSQTYSFKTSKPVASIKDFSFLVFGDAQDNGDDGHFSQVVKEMKRSHGDVDFIISTGDLAANDRPGLWWTFFWKGRDLFANKVFMPAIGNHDTPTNDSNLDTSSFRYYFSLPDFSKTKRAYYSFRFGPGEFLAFNSEDHEDFLNTDGEQLEWLKRILRQREFTPLLGSNPSWSFGYWHIPPFNVGGRHYHQRHISRYLLRSFDGGIDWHFGGHEHLYQRFLPIKMRTGFPRVVEDYGVLDNQGVGYLVTPSSGARPNTHLAPLNTGAGQERRLVAHPQIMDSADAVPAVIGFVRVDIRDREFNLRTFGFLPHAVPAKLHLPNQVYDQVLYSK